MKSFKETVFIRSYACKVCLSTIFELLCRNVCFRERERQLQLTIKPKHTFAPIGRAIFSRIWKDSASFKS
jgi:hypothetical protein